MEPATNPHEEVGEQDEPLPQAARGRPEAPEQDDPGAEDQGRQQQAASRLRPQFVVCFVGFCVAPFLLLGCYGYMFLLGPRKL